MKKLAKWLMLFVGGIALLLLVAAIAIKIYLTPERVRKIVEEQVATQLHRQVKLGGISVGLVHGLSVTDFSLSESPDFSKGIFIQCEKFEVRPQLLPLLSKKFFISQMTLVKPKIVILRMNDGKTFNFSSMAGSPENTSSAKSDSSSAPTAFLVSKIIIENGELKFIDQSPAAQSMDIKNLDLVLKNVSLLSPFEIQASFDVALRGVASKLIFEGTVHPLKGLAKIKSFQVSNGSSIIQANGDLTDITGANPKVDLKIKIPKLEPSFLKQLGYWPNSLKINDSLAGDIHVSGDWALLALNSKLTAGALGLNTDGDIKNVNQPTRSFKLSFVSNNFPVKNLLSLMPPDSLPEAAKLSGNTQLSVDFNGTADAGQLNFKMDGQSMDIKYADKFSKGVGAPMSLAINSAYSFPFALDMKKMALNLSKAEMTGSGSYKSLKNRSDYLINLNSNTFPLEDVSPFLPIMKDYGFTGPAFLSTKIQSSPSGAQVKGTAKLLGDSMAYSGVKLSNIQGKIDFTDADAAGSLTSDLIKHDYFSGQQLKLDFDLKEAADMAKINGIANLKIGKGEFQNIQKLTADSKAAKILLMPITLLQKVDKAAKGALKLPDFNKVSYQSILGEYVFKSGTMNISKFDLVGSEVGANMKGTVGLIGNQSLNLTGQVKVAAGLIAGFVGEALNDEQGKTTLNMIVKGTVQDPQISLDLKDTGKKVFDAVKEKLGDKPKEQIENLLKGLFKK